MNRDKAEEQILAFIERQECPNYLALSYDDLVDLFGAFKRIQKFMKQLEGDMRDELINSMPRGRAQWEGEDYKVKVSQGHRESMDLDRLRRDFSQELIKRYTKHTRYTQLNCTPLKKEGNDNGPETPGEQARDDKRADCFDDSPRKRRFNNRHD